MIFFTFNILCVLSYVSISSVISMDLCLTPDKTLLSSQVIKGAIPDGEIQASSFSPIPSADTLLTCIEACCDNLPKKCQVAFFHEKQCVLIACNSSLANICKPVLQSEKNMKNAFLIRLRSNVEEKAFSSTVAVPRFASESFAKSVTDDQIQPNKLRKCFDVGKDIGCGMGEECGPSGFENVEYFVCRCKVGYVRQYDGLGFSLSECRKNDEHSVNQLDFDMTSSVNSTASFNVLNSTEASSFGNNITYTNSSSTIMPKIQTLIVSVGENRTLTLPQDSVTLKASVTPIAEEGTSYEYSWQVVQSPSASNDAFLRGKNSHSLEINKLTLGKYVFKISVIGKNSYGENVVQVTVLPPKRKNKPPIAVIEPPFQEVKLPNNVVLDGSKSHDDDRIVSYEWVETSGPLKSSNIKGSQELLQLSDIEPGVYVFKLTVTDSDGATAFATANVTVVKEVDYPPVANPGHNLIVYLPQTSIILYGNGSTDDKGIVSYEWTKIGDDKLTADMNGVRTATLTLTNLQVGDYTFQLKVKDASGQTNSALIKVFVKPKSNTAPIADAGPPISVSLPRQSVQLNGSLSRDDEAITRYFWEQISGPHRLLLVGADTIQPTVSELRLGHYRFRLSVSDKEGLTSQAETDIDVQTSTNQDPKARAGGDVQLRLPMDLVQLDGRQSWDDKEIIEFRWTRDASSLAAGDILNSSQHSSVLLLTNLVPGRYQFLLTVKDAEGLFSSDSASLMVEPDAFENSLLEMHLIADVHVFSEDNKQNLISQLKFLLKKSFQSGVDVIIRSLHRDFISGNLVVLFYVTSTQPPSNVINPSPHSPNPIIAQEVVRAIRHKLMSNRGLLLDYAVSRLNTFVCQNDCSGHGKCDPRSKECVCELFWMQSLIRTHFGDGESNCDWSVVYVMLAVGLLLFLLAFFVWICICCRKKCRRSRTKQLKYSLIEDADEKELAIRPSRKESNGYVAGRNGVHKLMTSDLSSEEETSLFVNRNFSSADKVEVAH